MKLVKQQGTHDCAAACLAMVLGLRKASDVYPWLGYDPSEVEPKGVFTGEVLAVLEKAGLNYTFADVTENRQGRQRVALPTAEELRVKLNSQQKGCAIVGVPSLNHENGFHFVVCHRGEVLDPSNDKTYNGTAYSLPLVEVIFVKEMV